MLFVIYNSNPHNNPKIPVARGWRLYTEEDWMALCHCVSNYFFYLAQEEPELLNKTIAYYSYQQWLNDYQVSEIEEYVLGSDGTELLNYFHGTDFYEPPFPALQITIEDDPIYPEMDAYA